MMIINKPASLVLVGMLSAAGFRVTSPCQAGDRDAFHFISTKEIMS